MTTIALPVPYTVLLLAIMLAVVPWLMRRWRLTPEQAGWCRPDWRTAVQGVSWGLLLGVVSLGWLRALLATGNYLPIPAPISPAEALLAVVAIPLTEELLYRGVIVAYLQRHWHPAWAVLLSSALFTVLHPYDPWLAYLFLTGIGYALAFRAAGSVLAPMLAHVLVATVLLVAYARPGLVQALPINAFIIIAVCAGVGILVSSRRPASVAASDTPPFDV